VLEDPTGVEEDEWILSGDSPIASYAPAYAPEIGAATGQIARFRRGDSVLVVASYRFPPGEGETLLPGEATLPEDGQGALYLLPGGGLPWYGTVTPAPAGVLQLAVAPGPYLLSLELFSPGEMRGARLRRGLTAQVSPPDVPSVSDLLILGEGAELPAGFRDALTRVRPHVTVSPGERIPLMWEVYGLGLQREAPHFHVSIRRRERSLVRRLAGWIGLGGDDPQVVLSWMEAAPNSLSPLFRAVYVDLPELEPGEHVLRLQVELRGRSTMVSERTFEVR
jgi:hypothetical protein